MKGNPAESFYKRLGGEIAGEKTINIGGQDYLEAAYGWKNLNRFGL
ncbi:MAG: hypothetical protein WD273_11630 [Trueperaceae bacterium]